MTEPLDPNNLPDEPTEFGWGPGLFAPGTAENEGNQDRQDDFADPYKDILPSGEAKGDNYARAVADRRTDPTDPDSGRDFTTAGNPDRYGAQPPLIRDTVQPNVTERPEWEPRKLERRW